MTEEDFIAEVVAEFPGVDPKAVHPTPRLSWGGQSGWQVILQRPGVQGAVVVTCVVESDQVVLWSVNDDSEDCPTLRSARLRAETDLAARLEWARAKQALFNLLGGRAT